MPVDNRDNGRLAAVPATDGSVDRVSIIQGSGDRNRDRMIEAQLSRLTRLPNAPPAGFPMPATLTVVSHG